MTGRRVEPDPNDSYYPCPRLQPGDYGKGADDVWYCHPPSVDKEAAPGCLLAHRITEHEDGTITVEPSILVESSLGSWHGYLRRGEWVEC
jgi:hypothetical protein